MEKVEEFVERGKFLVDIVTRNVRKLGEEFGENGRASSSLLSFSLGTAFGVGLGLFYLSSTHIDFGIYLVFLSFFHFSEYITTAKFNPSKLSNESYLINHSNAYTIAFFASLIEYFVESSLFPFMKNIRLFYFIGGGLTLAGIAIRLVAMWTAGFGFTHIVQDHKREGHHIITHGVYRFSRHPGYVGWFLFAVFQQLLLFNPICLVAFFFVSYNFFDARIEDEERSLLNMFDEYAEYRSKVPIIPFFRQPHRWGITPDPSSKKTD